MESSLLRFESEINRQQKDGEKVLQFSKHYETLSSLFNSFKLNLLNKSFLLLKLFHCGEGATRMISR